jgi:TBC1 domain family protein 5
MLKRPDPALIKNAYDQLFHSGISLSKIRDAVIGDRLFSVSNDPEIFAVVGRSILWKLFLLRQGPLKVQTEDIPKSPLQAVKLSRERYRTLLVDKLRAPDGSLEDGFIIPGTTTPHKRSQDTPVNLETNNPLSLHEEVREHSPSGTLTGTDTMFLRCRTHGDNGSPT